MRIQIKQRRERFCVFGELAELYAWACREGVYEGAAKYIISIGIEAGCIWVGVVSALMKEVKSGGRGEGSSDM